MTERQERLIKVMLHFDETARGKEEGMELSSSYYPDEAELARRLSSSGCAYVELSNTKGTGEPCIRFHGFTDKGRQVYGGFAPVKV